MLIPSSSVTKAKDGGTVGTVWGTKYGEQENSCIAFKGILRICAQNTGLFQIDVHQSIIGPSLEDNGGT